MSERERARRRRPVAGRRGEEGGPAGPGPARYASRRLDAADGPVGGDGSGPGPAPYEAREERHEGEVTLQLLPHHMQAGSVPILRIGDEMDIAPAIYAGVHLPAVSGRDRWRTDRFGCFDGRGTIVAAPLGPGECECRVDVLDVAGRLFPLNWAGTAPADGRLWVDGSLYFEPALACDTEHGAAVALCRRRYRVTGLRRYVRGPYGPHTMRRLDAVPDPDETSDEELYVADLCLIEHLEDLSTAIVRDAGPG